MTAFTVEEWAKNLHRWLMWSSDPDDIEIKKLTGWLSKMAAEEREACAKIAEDFGSQRGVSSDDIAFRIRERGKQ